MYGRSYNKKYLDYVFVDDIGDIIKPDYVSNKFRELLKEKQFKNTFVFMTLGTLAQVCLLQVACQ